MFEPKVSEIDAISTAVLSATPCLQATGLNHQYGSVKAVREVSLSVAAGELLAMIGPNGAGKSTVFGLLSGDFLQSTAKYSTAKILLNRVDITHASIQTRARAGLGRSFQSAVPFLTLSVLDNLRVAAQLCPQPVPEAQIESILQDSGLMAAQHTAVADLPYPDWKRLDLALALVQSPKVLLLDEPTAGLSPLERSAMMGWVKRIAREQGVGMLFTEHNLNAVFEYADRVLVLDRGSVLAIGTSAEIAANPQVQAAYTGAYRMQGAAK